MEKAKYRKTTCYFSSSKSQELNKGKNNYFYFRLTLFPTFSRAGISRRNNNETENL